MAHQATAAGGRSPSAAPSCKGLDRRLLQASRPLRCVVLGIVSATLTTWKAAQWTPNFCSTNVHVILRAKVQRYAAGSPQGTNTERKKTPASGVMPVVDTSDFDADGGSSPGGKKESLESLMQAAKGFAAKKDLARRAAKNSLSLEDDLRGLSLEDDVDVSMDMVAAARRPASGDISLEGRFSAWLKETWSLITNPSPIQINYLFIFVASIGLLFVVALITFSLGGIKQRGEDADAMIRYDKMRRNSMVRKYDLIRANRERFEGVEDLAEWAEKNPNVELIPPLEPLPTIKKKTRVADPAAPKKTSPTAQKKTADFEAPTPALPTKTVEAQIAAPAVPKTPVTAETAATTETAAPAVPKTPVTVETAAP